MKPLLFEPGGETLLGRRVCDRLGVHAGQFEIRAFPDGECYIRIDEECAGREVVLFESLDHPDEKTLRLILLADTLRDLGAVRIGLVAPYLAYMRQDARFRAGEGITAHYYPRLLSAHFDWLVTVDPHLHRIHGLEDVYSIPASAVPAAAPIADWIAAHLAEPLLIGPDAESKQWVADVAARIGAPYLVLTKTRSGDRRVAVSIPDLQQHRRRTPVILDDIISTGHTLMATIEHLAASGTPAPVCVAVHGLFCADALGGLERAGVGSVVTTNSVAHASNQIDLTEVIATAVRAYLP